MAQTNLPGRDVSAIKVHPMIKGLRTTIYKVPDLAAAKAWYSKVFDITPYFDEPFYVGFNIGGFELGLDPDASAINMSGGVLTYWAVDDVDKAYQRLLSFGAKPHEAPKEVGDDIKVATVIDLFGNIIGVIYNPHFDSKAVR
jgi:predicted enzyme related to lactoylglutathione lyase